MQGYGMMAPQAYGMPQQMPQQQYGMYGQAMATGGGYPAQQQQQQQQSMSAGYAQMPAASKGVAPLPGAGKPVSPWSEHRTDDGVPYWYNTTTRVSQVHSI